MRGLDAAVTNFSNRYFRAADLHGIDFSKATRAGARLIDARGDRHLTQIDTHAEGPSWFVTRARLACSNDLEARPRSQLIHLAPQESRDIVFVIVFLAGV